MTVRTLKLAGLAAVGVAALTACTNVQGAALYVGDERVPEATIDGYVDDQVESYFEQGATQADIDYGANREAAVTCVLFAEIGRAEEMTAPDTSQAVSELDAECVEAQAYVSAIAEEAEPRELNDEELAFLRDAGYDWDSLRPTDQESLMVSAGLTDAISAYFEEYDVRVNPRFGVDSFSLMSEDLEGLFEVEIPQR